ERLTAFGVDQVETERNRVAAEKVADLVRPGRPLLADNPHGLERREVRPGPLFKELGDGAVEGFVWHGRWPGEISINVIYGEGIDDHFRACLDSPADEQDALDCRIELPDAREQL